MYNIDVSPKNEKRKREKDKPNTKHKLRRISLARHNTNHKEDLQAADYAPKGKQENIKGIRRLFSGEQPTNERRRGGWFRAEKLGGGGWKANAVQWGGSRVPRIP